MKDFEKWENEEFIVTRKKYADAVGDEGNKILGICKMMGDKKLFNLLRELLADFSASVAVRLFEEDKIDEDEEV